MAAGARLHLTAECLNPPVEQVPLVRGSVARVPFLASNTSDERISMNTNRALRTSAIAFAVLYFVAMFAPDLPEGTYSDSRVLGLVNDDGSMVVLAGYALSAAGAVFLCWLAGVTTRLRGAGGSALVDLALLAGAAYGVLLMVASTFFSTIALGHSIGELPPAEDAFLVRAFSNQGFHLVLVPALLCAGLLMTAVSLGARRRGRPAEVGGGGGAAPGPLDAGLRRLGAAVPGPGLGDRRRVLAADDRRSGGGQPPVRGVPQQPGRLGVQRVRRRLGGVPARW